jgi:hypothetical protein
MTLCVNPVLSTPPLFGELAWIHHVLVYTAVSQHFVGMDNVMLYSLVVSLVGLVYLFLCVVWLTCQCLCVDELSRTSVLQLDWLC